MTQIVLFISPMHKIFISAIHIESGSNNLIICIIVRKETIVQKQNLLNNGSFTKTCLYNSEPLKLHFYTVKLEFTEVYIIFLISAQKIYCWYALEPLRRGGSNEYSQYMFLSRNMNKVRFFFI